MDDFNEVEPIKRLWRVTALLMVAIAFTGISYFLAKLGLLLFDYLPLPLVTPDSYWSISTREAFSSAIAGGLPVIFLGSYLNNSEFEISFFLFSVIVGGLALAGALVPILSGAPLSVVGVWDHLLSAITLVGLLAGAWFARQHILRKNAVQQTKEKHAQTSS